MEEKTLTSEFSSLADTEFKTVPEFLLHSSEIHNIENGKKGWLIEGITGARVRESYGTFDEQTRKIASKFHKNGMYKGDFVLYMTDDIPKLHLLLTGVWRANGSLRASYSEDDFETILERVRETKSKWIVCESDCIELCLKIKGICEWPLEIIVLGDSLNYCETISFEEYLNDDGLQCPQLEITEDDTALVLSTSGTSGRSKGAVLTHKALLNNIRILSHLPFTKNKPNLLAGKAVHISGAVIPLALFVSGNTGIAISKFDKNTLMELVHKYKGYNKIAFVNGGYVRSGDIGHYDKNGYLFVTDRIKEIFKYYTHHVCPSEIENLIAQHHKVKEVCVIGFPHEESGDVPRAFVTLRDSVDSSQADLSRVAEDIKTYANSKLTSYEQIAGGVYIMKDLPKHKRKEWKSL